MFFKSVTLEVSFNEDELNCCLIVNIFEVPVSRQLCPFYQTNAHPDQALSI